MCNYSFYIEYIEIDSNRHGQTLCTTDLRKYYEDSHNLAKAMFVEKTQWKKT